MGERKISNSKKKVPLGVMIISIILSLIGLLYLIALGLLFFVVYAFGGIGSLMALESLFFLIPIIFILLVIFLIKGKNWARIIVIIGLIISLVWAILSIFLPLDKIIFGSIIPGGEFVGIKHSFWDYVKDAIYIFGELIILFYLLFNKKAKEFFKK